MRKERIRNKKKRDVRTCSLSVRTTTSAYYARTEDKSGLTEESGIQVGINSSRNLIESIEECPGWTVELRGAFSDTGMRQ
jgi:hypothetical protein